MDKRKLKTFEQKATKSLYGQRHNLTLWFVWISIHCELKIYKLGRVDNRIPILQLDPGATSKTKAKPRYESRKMVLKLELGSWYD